jgi:hypothetical protein
MASVDVQQSRIRQRVPAAAPGAPSIDSRGKRACPRADRLGRSLFTFHAIVGLYLLFGWLAPQPFLLAFYLVLLPAVAIQWLLNDGSCVLNNFETWLRHGRWRDPRNPEEGRFLAMLAHWLFRWQPSRATLDALSYGIVALLWLAGFAHLSVLWRG